jgi:hypothetical protein
MPGKPGGRKSSSQTFPRHTTFGKYPFAQREIFNIPAMTTVIKQRIGRIVLYSLREKRTLDNDILQICTAVYWIQECIC